MSGGGGRTRPERIPTVYIAGDSTVMTYKDSSIHQAGWGQFFGEQLGGDVAVDNRAIGGRTSRRFIEEDRLSAIFDAVDTGDYLFVQFGTNDSNKTASYSDGESYFLDAATDFKMWMQQYITGAKMRGVNIVLVTPPPRKSCKSDGTSFNYSFGAYATAMSELAQANDVPLIDLGHKTVEFLDQKQDCDWSGENFFLIRADGSIDATHFSESGARVLAQIVARGVVELGLPLQVWVTTPTENRDH